MLQMGATLKSVMMRFKMNDIPYLIYLLQKLKN